VATYSTGVGVSFAGTFSEVRSVSWTWGAGLTQGYNALFVPEVGSVTIECLGGVSTALYGQRDTLTITGGGVNLTCVAVCTAVSAASELNGVTSYIVEFTILDN